MRLLAPLAVGTVGLLSFTACSTSEPEPSCKVTLDSLAGTTWVENEIQSDKTEVPNPMARMRFYEDDGLKVKYTVKSLGRVYDYECEKSNEDELFCAEPPRIADWCKALMAYEYDACTVEKLKEYGADGVSDEEIKKGMEEAKKEWEEYKDNAKWVLMNNNLGNALRGMLYVKVNKRSCSLNVDDMYMTIHDGEKKEDYNPVGKNEFVSSDVDWLFEDCPDGRSLADLTTEERAKPDEIPAQRVHETGKPVYYHYYGEDAVEAEEGCSYSFDTWANWQKKDSGIEASVEDGKVMWTASHSFAADDRIDVAPGKSGGVFTMVRYKECGGEKEQIGVVCNAALVK